MKRVPEKYLLLLYGWHQSLRLWGSQQTGKFWKRWEYQTSWPAFWEICMQVKKQQLELDMEQQTCSKSGKEYIKAVYCHPGYLTYLQSTLEKVMATHSSTLAWRIPWMEEPGGLQSMGSQRVGHDWALTYLITDFLRFFYYKSFQLEKDSLSP